MFVVRAVAAVAVNYPSAKVVKVTDAGAVADEKTLCTDAIRKAIEEVAAAGVGLWSFAEGGVSDGGDTAQEQHYACRWMRGRRSSIATDPKLYPLEKSRYEAVDIMNYSSAYLCSINARMSGSRGRERLMGRGSGGGIGRGIRRVPPGGGGGGGSGQGVGGTAEAKRLMALYTADRAGKYPLEQRVFGEKNTGYRPCLIEMYQCKNVLIEGVTVRESPFWTIHPVYTENFTLRDAHVTGAGPNTDGCDPDSCKTVLIERVVFDTGDDCIAIKSGRDGDGIPKECARARIWTIRDCKMNGGHGAITLSGVGDVGGRYGTCAGGELRDQWAGCGDTAEDGSAESRGGIEDFMARNITVKSAKQTAILVTLRYGSAVPETPKGETTPVAKNIWIEDLTCDAAPQAISLLGLNVSRTLRISR